MERAKFVAEGRMEIGPKEEFFTFLDGEHLGKLLVRHRDAWRTRLLRPGARTRHRGAFGGRRKLRNFSARPRFRQNHVMHQESPSVEMCSGTRKWVGCAWLLPGGLRG